MRSLNLSSLTQAYAGATPSASAAVADALTAEFKSDSFEFLGLWQLANRCVELVPTQDAPCLRDQTLLVAADLMRRQIEPGDYDAAGFHPWPGSVEERVARIDAAWVALGRTPDIVDPICWFAKRV